MHYYKKNIGDYHKKAGRLTMLEHGAYTLLIDSCYDRERFPTKEEAMEWTWARSEQEKEAVLFVLSRFFELRDGVYIQNRIEEELTKYKENAENNARIARDREEKRRNRTRSSTDRARTVDESQQEQHEAPPNQEPLTINQEPNTPVGEAAPPQAPSVWDIWLGIVGESPGNRSYLGKQIKYFGEESVAQAVAILSTRKPAPADPKQFLVGMLREREPGATMELID